MWSISLNEKDYKPILRNSDQDRFYKMSATEALIFRALFDHNDQIMSIEDIARIVNKQPQYIFNILSRWNNKGIEDFPLFCIKGRGWMWCTK